MTSEADETSVTNNSPFTCVLWDVDGTIVDASEGILRRLTKTLSHFNKPVPSHEDLVDWIGPPQHHSMQVNVGMSPEEATEAVAFYRKLNQADGYATGAKLFPGVRDLIVDLHAAGIPQATASSKPEDQVRSLADHFELDDYFQHLVGASIDEKTLAAKSDIIAESLRRLAADGVDVSRPVMIGDRHHDVSGAALHNIPVIFVRWGFSHPEESEGSIAAVETSDELRKILLPS